jgi:hypothetical protein
LPARCGLAERVAAFCGASEHLCPFLLHELLFRPKLGIRVHSRYEIPITLQQSCRENTGAQVGVEPLSYRTISQVRLFQNLPAGPCLLGKEALEFHHETSFPVHDFEDLVSRGRHAVKVVRDNICRARRHTR